MITKDMDTFEILGISEYKERIFKSNSHGELFHLAEYQEVASILLATDESSQEVIQRKFAIWFRSMVRMAEATWNRPESVFQHLVSLMSDTMGNVAPSYLTGAELLEYGYSQETVNSIREEFPCLI